MTESPSTTTGEQSVRPFAIEAARLLADRRCTDVVLLDVSGLSQVTDYVLIGTGTSDRQMRSVADEVRREGKAEGHVAYTNDRDPNATWLVVDFIDLVVHLFEPNQRAYYDLETLWADATQVDWKRSPEEEAAHQARVAADVAARREVTGGGVGDADGAGDADASDH